MGNIYYLLLYILCEYSIIIYKALDNIYSENEEKRRLFLSNKGKTYKNRGIERGDYTIVEKTFREVVEHLEETDPDFPVKTISGVKQMMIRAFYKLALNVVSEMMNKPITNKEVKAKAKEISEQEYFHSMIVDGIIRRDAERAGDPVGYER